MSQVGEAELVIWCAQTKGGERQTDIHMKPPRIQENSISKLKKKKKISHFQPKSSDLALQYSIS